MRPFSPEWFAQARAIVAPIELPADRGARLQFEAGAAQWFLTIAGGRVTGWDLGRIDDPDVEVRWSLEDAERIAARTLRGTEAIAATTVTASATGGTYVGTPAPMNLSGRPELAAMPVVPGATFSVSYLNRNGPFGDVDYVLRFEDGRLAEEKLGRVDDAEVVVEVSYRAMALVRAGEIDILEALETGSVQGELGPLATLAGITESPAFHAAEEATGRHALALAVLGDLDSHPMFGPAMEQLATRTHEA